MRLMDAHTVIDSPVENETRQAGTVIQQAQHFVTPKPPLSVRKPYAGFWIRVEAFLTDVMALYAILLVSMFVLVLGLAYLTSVTLYGVVIVVLVYLLLFVLIGTWLYFSLFESSRKQATPGKLLLCLKVVAPDGSRLSFGRATERYFAKFLSGLTFGVGYLIAGVTRKKQALHDMITRSFVVRR